MKPAEFLLAGGLACTAVAGGLCEFVMIGLIGLALFVVALGLLLGAGILALSVEPIPVWQKGGSFILYVVGIVLLLGVTAYASSLAYDWGISTTRSVAAPTILDWGLVGLFSLLPTALIAGWLRYGMRSSLCRCALWGTAALFVCPASAFIFWCLLPVLPISV